MADIKAASRRLKSRKWQTTIHFPLTTTYAALFEISKQKPEKHSCCVAYLPRGMNDESAPSGQRANSPGQRPGKRDGTKERPVRAKARLSCNAVAPSGRIPLHANTPGCCPGLCAGWPCRPSLKLNRVNRVIRAEKRSMSDLCQIYVHSRDINLECF